MNPQPAIVAPGRPPLVIVGASCRAAAMSAAAAGWSVYAADVFDDVDLRAAAVATRRLTRYPAGIMAAVGSFPPGPWCYTGAIENHPDIIADLAATRPLAANGPAAVRRIRDPASLAALVRAAGLRYPDTLESSVGVPPDGSFLRKPRTSAGGHGIVPWTGGLPPGTGASVWQRRVAGESLAAVMSLTQGGARLLGLSRQLVGTPWCRAPAFSYCGSLRVPLDDAPTAVTEQFAALATALSARAGLRGIVGVDAVLEADGRVTVIEVNPRPTASAELIERSTGTSIMATHLAAFGGLSSQADRPASDTIWSKAILFAAVPVNVDAALLARLHVLGGAWTRTDGLPALADVPSAGQVLRPRSPILTVFARGDSEPGSVAALRRRIEAVTAVTG